MKRNLHFFAIALATTTLALAQTTETQTWTSSDGRVIQAKFIKLEGEFVTVETGGQQHKFSLTRLSPESTALAKKLGGASPSEPSAAQPVDKTSSTMATTGPSIDFLGKTFEQCEAVLGKPEKSEGPNGEWRSFARYYKSTTPGITRFKLERVPSGSMAGPVPETVNSVWLYFPKGQIKTLGQALTLAGLSNQGVSLEDWETPLQQQGSALFNGIQGGLKAAWGTAEDSKKMPPQYQHPQEDTLWLTGKISQETAAETKTAMAPAAPLPPPVSWEPTQLFGQTYEACEKVLGAPTKSSTPSDGGRPVFSREYKSAAAGITRIELVRMPEGSMSNPPPETVNSITYYVPKGSLKTMGSVFDKLALDRTGVSNRTSYKSREASEAAKKPGGGFVSPWDEPLPADGQTSRSAHKIKGGLAASFIPAATTLTSPARYQHPDEDAIQIKKDTDSGFGGGSPAQVLAVNDSPELRKNGAFGFPQAAAKVLRESREARYSAWSNSEWLYVQVVVWADGDDALGTLAGSSAQACDQTVLLIDADADQQDTPNVDRKYTLDPFPTKRGLYLQTSLGEGKWTGISEDSKGRGSIRFLPANDGKKIRVDSFLIPLHELGRKPGETIRLILSGTSKVPVFSFNSGGLTTNGKAMFYSSMPKRVYHPFTLGQQTGTLDPAQVPEGRAP